MIHTDILPDAAKFLRSVECPPFDIEFGWLCWRTSEGSYERGHCRTGTYDSVELYRYSEDAERIVQPAANSPTLFADFHTHSRFEIPMFSPNDLGGASAVADFRELADRDPIPNTLVANILFHPVANGFLVLRSEAEREPFRDFGLQERELGGRLALYSAQYQVFRSDWEELAERTLSVHAARQYISERIDSIRQTWAGRAAVEFVAC